MRPRVARAIVRSMRLSWCLAWSLPAGLLWAGLLGAGCYLSHRRPEDAPQDAGTRCGAASCALAPRGSLRVTLDPPEPPLGPRFEANAIGIDPGPDDGIAVLIDTCDGGCPRSILISRVGSDRADPAVLSGPVEISMRPDALVIRADPCPGCDDGGVAAQLYLAAVSGERTDADLELRGFRVEVTEPVCDTRGPSGASRRVRISFTGPAGLTFDLDEGETRGLGGDHAARVLLSHDDCLPLDLPPPPPLATASWIIYAIGPR